MLKKFKTDNFLAWYIVALIFFCFVWLKFIMQGMFFDGLLYASISMNLASDLGSWDQLYYTKTIYPGNFYEHPPLAFILQSFFFKVLGEGYLTEKIYNLILLLLQAFMIISIWKDFNKNLNIEQSSLKKLHWLPLFIWLLIPLTSDSPMNNYLEATLSFFTLFSIFAFTKVKVNTTFFKKLFYIFIGSLGIILGLLSKGPIGLFPLAFFFILSLTFNNKKYILYGLYVVIITAMLFFIIISGSNELYIYLKKYWEGQVVASISGNRIEHRGNNIFLLLFDKLKEVIIFVPLVILLTKWKFKKFYRLSKNNSPNQNSQKKIVVNLVTFLLLGLSATLPMGISKKIAGYYLSPGLVYFAFASAYTIIFFIKIEEINIEIKLGIKKVLIFLLSAFFFSSLFLTNITYRNQKEISYTRKIKEIIPPETIVEYRNGNDWQLAAYLYRYNKVSLQFTESSKEAKTKFVISKEEIPNSEAYKKTDLLYKNTYLFIRK